MKQKPAIVTVAVSPAWDTALYLEQARWNHREIVSSRLDTPAGKALNISKALAWINTPSTAMGLWAKTDYEQMKKALAPLTRKIYLNMTLTAGQTRQNITVIDLANNRQMHLRNKSALASRTSLKNLKNALLKTLTKNCFTVFAGSLPPDYTPQILKIVRAASRKSARIALDTHSQPLKDILDHLPVYLLHQNLSELSQLLDKQIPDSLPEIIAAAKTLLPKVSVLLISMGQKGALLITSKTVYHACCSHPSKPVGSTVGCGDYLLAGLMAKLASNASNPKALEFAVKLATAKAWSLDQREKWSLARNRISVKIKKIQ